MKSQMAACRLAARRMDELFDKYGRDTILAGDRADLRRDRAQVPQRRRRSSRTASTRREPFIDDDGVKRGEPVPIHVKVTVDRQRHDDRPVGLLAASARPAINSRTLAGARVAYKALTGPLDPVNEGSFRALKVDHPGRQHHDGAISRRRWRAGARSCRRWSTRSSRALAHGHAGPRAGRRITALLGGAVVFFGVHPKTATPVRRAEHRGRRLGRPALSRTASPALGLGLPGRRAQRARSKASSSNARCWSRARAAHAIPAAPASFAAGSGIDMQVRNLVEGRWNFEQTRRAHCPPWGLWGGTAGDEPTIICCGSRARTISALMAAIATGAGRVRGDRAHRRRRRLGRSARARCAGGARRRDRRALSRARLRATSTAS